MFPHPTGYVALVYVFTTQGGRTAVSAATERESAAGVSHPRKIQTQFNRSGNWTARPAGGRITKRARRLPAIPPSTGANNPNQVGHVSARKAKERETETEIESESEKDKHRNNRRQSIENESETETNTDKNTDTDR